MVHQVLDKYGVDDHIGLKLQGSINKGPWKAACKKKFKQHPEGYEMAMTKLISEWEGRIGDQSYHPFKNLNLGGDNWKVSSSHLYPSSPCLIANLLG